MTGISLLLALAATFPGLPSSGVPFRQAPFSGVPFSGVATVAGPMPSQAMVGESIAALAPSTSNACLPVKEDRIFARDIVAVIPEFAKLPSQLVLSYAPAPGLRRVLSAGFLQKTAKSQGLEIESAPDVCFERALSALQGKDLSKAMHAALQDDTTSTKDKDAVLQIEILQWGPSTAPQGKIIFPLSAIQPPSQMDAPSEVFWRGYVSYAGTHRYPVWARARISGTVTRVVAIADIPAGKPIREEQVRQESVQQYALSALDPRPARRLDEVVGFLSHNVIRSGASVLRAQVSPPPEVIKGELVKVQVSAGSAHLILEARAQTSGSTGSPVWVRNISSGKEFRATVAGKGTVTLEDGSVKGDPLQ